MKLTLEEKLIIFKKRGFTYNSESGEEEARQAYLDAKKIYHQFGNN